MSGSYFGGWHGATHDHPVVRAQARPAGGKTGRAKASRAAAHVRRVRRSCRNGAVKCIKRTGQAASANEKSWPNLRALTRPAATVTVTGPLSGLSPLIGVGRKRDQRLETGAACRAQPNVTSVLVAPVLGPFGRNQLIIALNATHHVSLPTSMRR